MKELEHLKEDQKKRTACELKKSVIAKGLSTYDHVIFPFLFFNKCAKNSTFLGLFLRWVHWEIFIYLFLFFLQMAAMKPSE